MNNILQDTDFGLDYVLVYKDVDNILSELEFDTDEERIICGSIIKSLENTASEEFFKDKCVDIPYVGKAKINEVRKELVKNYEVFKEANKTLTKEQYADFKRNKILEIHREQRNKELNKKTDKFNRSKRFELWNRLARKYGFNYANCFIKFMNNFKAVEYDEETNELLVEYLTNKNLV